MIVIKKISVVVISGPTASGKTALSIDLAKKFNGEIVSSDSMQIYKGMDIGTAKPDMEERDGIVHHLMDFVSPRERYSVADYVEDAHKIIEDIVKRGKLPIIVGGTGLYINSLVDDVSFKEGTNDESIREELKKIAKDEGEEKLWTMLKEIDPVSAENIHKNNLKRVIRAIEYYKVTGTPISADNNNDSDSRYNPLMLAISWDREELYKRIDKRVDIMVEQGLFDEVRTLKNQGLKKDMQSMQGIGYRQVLNYFHGLLTFNETVNIIKRDSRRYAKRQLTWFRRDGRILWLDFNDEVSNKAENAVKEFLSLKSL